MSSDPAATIERFLTQSEIPFERIASGRWAAMVRGERKLTIPIVISVTGRRVTFDSFFMRRPHENAADFYELLLRRNLRAYGVAFALDADGDCHLIGQRPVDGLTEDELDRIVGSILTEADGLFNAAIAIGFESYLAADMRWRAAQHAKR